MKLLRALNSKLEIWLMIWLYGYIIIVVAVEVFRRFGIDYSSLWGEETARYMFVYMTWIGAAAAIKNRMHIRIDIFANILPLWGKAILNAIAALSGIIFACFALYLSFDPVITSFKFGSVTDGLRITKAWFLLAVPFGFSLVLIRLVQTLLIDLADIRNGTLTESKEKFFN